MGLVFSLSREWLPRLLWDVSCQFWGKTARPRVSDSPSKAAAARCRANRTVQHAGTTLCLEHTCRREVSLAIRVLLYRTRSPHDLSTLAWLLRNRQVARYTDVVWRRHGRERQGDVETKTGTRRVLVQKSGKAIDSARDTVSCLPYYPSEDVRYLYK